ncbi:S8 family peptidase [Meiothermus rufus]|uniref:S8 family peptidase n=1 Tax=Meiothermus rufus TaxID=604332 RepID=UPI00042939E6|nr:S8 family serine peptidase [Meiothermus rufus]
MDWLKFAQAAMGCIGIALLAGCGSASLGIEREAVGSRALRVEIAPGDSPQTLEHRYGGRMVVWNPQAGFALLQVDASNQSGEPNRRIFLASGQIAWMNGQSSLWAEGQSSLWAEGQSSLWAEGTYRLFPQNTPPWRQIGLDKAHAIATRMGRGVKVAVIDTGIDLNHPMIRTSLVPPNEWWDFVDNDPLPQEEGVLGEGGFGHGTNVAGIILQVAPAARIMPLRVLGPDGRGDVLALAAAIDWAMRHGAQIINLSLGSDDISPAVETTLQAAAAQGILIVASVGNRGNNHVSYPASLAHLEDRGGYQRLSVTSVRVDLEKSRFASYGPSVELAALGENIYGPAPDGRIAAWSGTSMAAPMASGALALALGEPLSVPAHMLADALYQSSNGVIYNNDTNRSFKDQVGKGLIDLESFLNNVVNR